MHGGLRELKFLPTLWELPVVRLEGMLESSPTLTYRSASWLSTVYSLCNWEGETKSGMQNLWRFKSIIDHKSRHYRYWMSKSKGHYNSHCVGLFIFCEGRMKIFRMIFWPANVKRWWQIEPLTCLKYIYHNFKLNEKLWPLLPYFTKCGWFGCIYKNKTIL